jgi:predicted RNA binding protein YcfA (HicA-like mRNA interferase family)
MTRLPRDVSGQRLAKALVKLGYAAGRQRGSHLAVTTLESGKHTLHIPLHPNLKPGMLSHLLGQVQAHFGLSRDQLLELLDL